MFRLKVRVLLGAFLISGLLLGSCANAIAQEPLMPGAKTVLPVFQNVVKQLQEKTRIPIVLPTQIPTGALVPLAASNGGSQPYINVPIDAQGQFQHIYASVLDSSEDGYELSLDATSDCHGADACSFGLVTAKRVYQTTLSVASAYAYEQQPDFRPIARSPEIMGDVELPHSIKGYFVPYVCGANCDTSKVFWEQNGVRYSVGIRMASKAAVVAMANSAIENEL